MSASREALRVLDRGHDLNAWSAALAAADRRGLRLTVVACLPGRVAARWDVVEVYVERDCVDPILVLRGYEDGYAFHRHTYANDGAAPAMLPPHPKCDVCDEHRPDARMGSARWNNGVGETWWEPTRACPDCRFSLGYDWRDA